MNEIFQKSLCGGKQLHDEKMNSTRKLFGQTVRSKCVSSKPGHLLTWGGFTISHRKIKKKFDDSTID